MYLQFQNELFLPGLIFMGASTVPLSTLVLFFELNTPRNISLYRVLALFLVASVVAQFLAALTYRFARLGWLGDSAFGITEEVGKLPALVVLTQKTRGRFILEPVPKVPFSEAS